VTIVQAHIIFLDRSIIESSALTAIYLHARSDLSTLIGSHVGWSLRFLCDGRTLVDGPRAA